MKPQKRTFADVTAKYIGKPFQEGARGPDAFDCLGFCFAILSELGKGQKIITEYGDLNIDNYHLCYKADVDQAEAGMFGVFGKMGEAVPAHGKMAGDLVIVKNDKGRFYPGIYAGNGHVMAAFVGSGVRVISTCNMAEIVMVRRL